MIHHRVLAPCACNALLALLLILSAMLPVSPARADHTPPGVQVIWMRQPAYLSMPVGTTKYTRQDIAQATELAKIGDAEAEANLGVMLASRGQYQQAVYWYRLAAYAGMDAAAYNLGTLYFNGRGFPQDYAKADYWFRIAARRGNPYAEFQLGLMHDTGQGVARDPVKELMWYRRAAGHGLPAAQYNIAIMYHTGEGAPKDNVQAYAWMLLARKGGLDIAGKGLMILGKNLSAAQIKSAHALSHRLVPTLRVFGR